MKSLTTLTSVVLITFLLIGCSPQRENIPNLEERLESFIENGTPIMVGGKPFTGIGFTEHSSGQIESELRFKKGIPISPISNYYENGQLREKRTFKDWKRDGLWEEYYGDGQLWVKRTYKDGVLDGPYERYHFNGQLEVKGTYKDGKKDGLWEVYNEDGTLDTDYSVLYKNGIRVSD
jgi:antitoxin component YwqK of YwqJK toxin-antitoxin module